MGEITEINEMGELLTPIPAKTPKQTCINNAWTNLSYQCKHHPSSDAGKWNNVIQMTHTFFLK